MILRLSSHESVICGFRKILESSECEGRYKKLIISCVELVEHKASRSYLVCCTNHSLN